MIILILTSLILFINSRRRTLRAKQDNFLSWLPTREKTMFDEILLSRSYIYLFTPVSASCWRCGVFILSSCQETSRQPRSSANITIIIGGWLAAPETFRWRQKFKVVIIGNPVQGEQHWTAVTLSDLSIMLRTSHESIGPRSSIITRLLSCILV